jgi:hypothetical protein
VSPLVLFVLGAAATLLLVMYSTFAPVTDEARAYMTALGTAAICSVCAAVVLGVALSFGRREPWRKQWLLVGLGVASFALGQVVRAAHIALGPAAAWLPAPDVFVLAQYLLLCAAFVAVAQSYRSVTDPRRPAIAVILFGAVALAALWFGLAVPFILPESTGVAVAMRATLYPAADILFLLVPAAFVAMTLAQLGGMRFARPWYLVAAGGGVLAITDTMLVWLTTMGTYLPGTLVDFGVIAAQLLIAAGSLAAARLAEEFMVPAHPVVVADSVMTEAAS